MTTIVIDGDATVAEIIQQATDALAGRASLITALEQTTAALAEAQDRIANYEHRISWETTCAGCANGLDKAYEETMRREQAEDRVRELEAEVRNQEDIVAYAHRLLDEEPFFLSMLRLTLMPVQVVRFLMGAARSAL